MYMVELCIFNQNCADRALCKFCYFLSLALNVGPYLLKVVSFDAGTNTALLLSNQSLI